MSADQHVMSAMDLGTVFNSMNEDLSILHASLQATFFFHFLQGGRGGFIFLRSSSSRNYYIMTPNFDMPVMSSRAPYF